MNAGQKWSASAILGLLVLGTKISTNAHLAGAAPAQDLPPNNSPPQSGPLPHPGEEAQLATLPPELREVGRFFVSRR
jgi:hypothetical protein